jgi:hypothetical protein
MVNVYRALRSINPSRLIYFFFDYGDFKIFGSSPEAQIIVKDRKTKFTLLQEHSNAQEMIGKMLFGSIIRRQKESE